MITKPDSKYAVIRDGKVYSIFSGKDVPEFDENSIFATEIPKNAEVTIGTPFDETAGIFVNLSIQELKAQKIQEINLDADTEIIFLETTAANSALESATWEQQLREAKEVIVDYLAPAPLLREIAATREMDLIELANKIVDKNAKYSADLGKITGYRQSLIKQIEAANTAEEIKSFSYKSPLLNSEVTS